MGLMALSCDTQMKVAELDKNAEVNPLAGCLPTLVTLPVWIGLYRCPYPLSSCMLWQGVLLAAVHLHMHSPVWIGLCRCPCSPCMPCPAVLDVAKHEHLHLHTQSHSHTHSHTHMHAHTQLHLHLHLRWQSKE